MINLRAESHFGWLERIVRREMDAQEENSTAVRAVGRGGNRCDAIWEVKERACSVDRNAPSPVLGSHNRRLPVEHVISDGTC